MLAFRPTDAVDRRVSDRLLASQEVAADSRIVLVETDSGDRREYYEGPLISREGVAVLLETLHAQGAEKVLLDLYLAEPIEPVTDARLEKAIAAFGPDRIALVSSPGPDDVPAEMFAQHVTVVDARLTPDEDGWNRILGSDQRRWGNNPAWWLADGSKKTAAVPLDIRVDAHQFRTTNLRSVVSGDVNYRGKTVIISPSAEVAPTRAYLPFTEAASRAAVFAVATQSAKTGYKDLVVRAGKTNLGLLIFASILGLTLALLAKSGRALVMRVLVGAIAILSVSVAILSEYGTAILPATALGCFFVFVNVTVIYRLGIMRMMDSFMRGDISPEEAWAWRTCEQSKNAAIMFSADGSIKRCNEPAETIVSDLRENLARLCFPHIGERAERIDYTDAMNCEWSYELEWPFSHLPIVVLRDKSADEALMQSLYEKAYNDDLTGCLNRRGFERALGEAAKSGHDYSIFFIDMNRFKHVNDTYGHDVGDELLVEVAKRLGRIAASGDTVARLGGDEFAIIRESGGGQKLAKTFAELIREAVSQPIRFDYPDVTLTPECAVGFACQADERSDPHELLRVADNAMYREKARQHAADTAKAA